MMRIFRTATFRITLINILLLVVAMAAIGIIGYRTTFRAAEIETEKIIDQEIELLAQRYAESGAGDLRQRVRNRAAWRDDSIYMLVRADTGVRLEGDLSSLPEPAIAAGDTLFRFTYDGRPLTEGSVEASVPTRIAVGKLVRFRAAEGEAPKFIILVAKDVTSRERLRDRIVERLWIIGVSTVLLGLIAGIVFSRSLTRQVEAINRAASDIRGGDMSRRITTHGSGDSLDVLAQNLNAMLDQIERLMTGMKEVSDNIAHDLRSPLTRIRNRLTDALTIDGPEKDEQLRATLCEAERMITTFNELLSIARIESGEVTGTREPVNIREITEEVVELYEPALSEAGFDLVLHAKPVPRVLGSRALISQAIANLLDNAMKYAVNGSRIEVTVRRDRHGNAYLSVADDGPGVPDNQFAHILERYTRLETSRTTSGNGLGLSLVSAIAHAHRADLALSAARKDADKPGLKVVIRFPRMV